MSKADVADRMPFVADAAFVALKIVVVVDDEGSIMTSVIMTS